MLSRVRRFRRQRPVLYALISAALLTAPCWVPLGALMGYVQYIRRFVWTAEDRAHKGEGFPSDARKWRAILQDIPDVEAAESHPELGRSPYFEKRRFPNGEWVFGISIDSHGWEPLYRGGTVVMKDSRGQVRVYYGHVCGASGPIQHGYHIEDTKSLDEFYNMFKRYDFTEQFLPP